MSQTTYPTFFSSPNRSSFIPVSSGSEGNITWSQELELPGEVRPRHLLVWEGRIVLETLSDLIVFTNEGERLWERKKQFNSVVAIASETMYYQNERLKLEAVDLSNGLVLDNAYFPDADHEDFPVSLLWPREDDFLAVIQFIGGGDAEEPPWAEVYMTAYGDRISTWDHTYEGTQALPPLFIPELERLLVAVREAVCFDTSTGQEVLRFSLPVSSCVNWSASADGDLYLLGKEGAIELLFSTSLTGEEKWRWSDLNMSESWSEKQPPIARPGGIVHVFSSQSVLTFQDGILLWEYGLRDETPGHGAALADGSLLITIGNKLYRLSVDGEELFVVSLENEILTPPVVDAAGNIYVATAFHLLQIR